MRELIEARRRLPPTDSNLERRFEELARRAGPHGFVRQVDVGDEHAWIGRVDFVDRDRRIIVETDTAFHHGSITDLRLDEMRRGRLRGAGWTVVVLTDIDVFHRPDEVFAELHRIGPLSSRRAS